MRRRDHIATPPTAARAPRPARTYQAVSLPGSDPPVEGTLGVEVPAGMVDVPNGTVAVIVPDGTVGVIVSAGTVDVPAGVVAVAV